MFNLFRNQKALTESINNYLQEVRLNSHNFSDLIKYYLESGINKEFHERAKSVHQSESRADDLRYQIEKLMYQHSLLPDSRSDIFTIIEALDKIPGIYEKTIEYLNIRKTLIPPELAPDVLVLTETAVMTADEVVRGTGLLFVQPPQVQGAIRNVDALESKCDFLLHHLLKKIFESGLEELYKERLAKIVELITEVSDQAELVGNRLVIAAIKRVY